MVSVGRNLPLPLFLWFHKSQLAAHGYLPLSRKKRLRFRCWRRHRAESMSENTGHEEGQGIMEINSL